MDAKTPALDPSAAGTTEGQKPENTPDPPFLREVTEILRNLAVAEKNFLLYPPYGKVVQSSIGTLYGNFEPFFDTNEELRLEITGTDFVYGGKSVYHEDDKRKSLSFRLYKDGVRDLVFHAEMTRDELQGFLHCVKEARNADDEEDDFITLFWETDCSGIHLSLADDYISKEDIPELAGGADMAEESRKYKFGIPKEERKRLAKVLESRRADDGDSTFELSEEEAAGIQEMVEREQNYFPVFDFVDILQELLVRNPDSENVSRSIAMIRALIASLIGSLSFDAAAKLMRKVSEDAHPGLSETSRSKIQAMLKSLSDQETLILLENYLKENSKLSNNHAVFGFMRAFPPTSAEDFCKLLGIQTHTASVVEVLVALGAGRAEIFAKYLTDPDPTVAKGMVDIMLRAEGKTPLKKVARALQHPNESVRLHAAKLLVDRGDASIAEAFLPLLHESSRQLLNLALQFFTLNVVPEAYEPLKQLTRGRGFAQIDQRRQQLCFRALLKTSKEGFEFIRSKVLGWGFHFGKTAKARRTAAISALIDSEHEEAEDVLRKFASQKRSPLSGVARRALKERELAKRTNASRSQRAKKNTKKEAVEVPSV